MTVKALQDWAYVILALDERIPRLKDDRRDPAYSRGGVALELCTLSLPRGPKDLLASGEPRDGVQDALEEVEHEGLLRAHSARLLQLIREDLQEVEKQQERLDVAVLRRELARCITGLTP